MSTPKKHSFPKITIAVSDKTDNSIKEYLGVLSRTSGVRYNSLKNYVSVIPSLMLTASWCANVTSGNYKTRTPYSVCFDVAVFGIVYDIFEQVTGSIVVCSLCDDKVTIAFDGPRTFAKVKTAWDTRYEYLFGEFEDMDNIMHPSDNDERDVIDYWQGK